jgi:phosphatidylglycerophosphate synthase
LTRFQRTRAHGSSPARPIAGTAIFWFASIADGIDGEMARLTVSDSEWGERLDTTVDLLTYVFALAGASDGGDRGWGRQARRWPWASFSGPVLAGAGCAFVVATLVVYRREIDTGIRRLAIYN